VCVFLLYVCSCRILLIMKTIDVSKSSHSQIIFTNILADNQNSQHTKNLMSTGKPGATQGYYDESMRVDWTQEELKVNQSLLFSHFPCTHTHKNCTKSLSYCMHTHTYTHSHTHTHIHTLTQHTHTHTHTIIN